MDPVRRRLLLALAASCAVHLSLLYTVRPAPPQARPAPLALHARLSLPAALPDTAAEPPLLSRAPRVPATRNAQPTGPLAEPPDVPGIAAVAGEPLQRVAATRAPAHSSAALELPLLPDTTWYAARQLDVFPRALTAVEPAYPEPASAADVGGEVTLLLRIDEHGTVHEVAVVEAQPPGYFEDAAVAALRAARFEPALKDGRAVRSRILVKVAFSAD